MENRIRFYTDEHVSKAVINGLRQRGIDVLTTPESAKIGETDLELLTFAKKKQRVIFTQDADFLMLHADGLQHSDIVYTSPMSPIGQIIRGLVLIHEVYDRMRWSTMLNLYK